MKDVETFVINYEDGKHDYIYSSPVSTYLQCCLQVDVTNNAADRHANSARDQVTHEAAARQEEAAQYQRLF